MTRSTQPPEVSQESCAALSATHGWAPSFGLTPEQALWLAYRIGECVYASGQVTSGRDIMRVIHARWDQMGCPLETMGEFERAILGNDHPFALGTLDIQRRAIRALAGNCPIGPLDRITG